ncbi:hypothetical protein NSQ29_03725 [Paenibacillus sp. FSL F4-0236]|uniref:hypothetical protein n=1 Tax=unclassified Paenibacillus TaxID=185978 RepID=UPI0030F84D6B
MINFGDSVGKTFNAMAWAIAEGLGLYLVFPMLVTAILLRILRVKGEAHKFLVGIVGLVGLYLFFQYGIDDFGAKIQQVSTQ